MDSNKGIRQRKDNMIPNNPSSTSVSLALMIKPISFSDNLVILLLPSRQGMNMQQTKQ